MKGDPKVIAALNAAINLQLGLVNQFWLQAHIVREWGYKRLGCRLKEISRCKHHHIHQFTDRILNFDSMVEMKPDPITQASSVEDILTLDLKAETSLVTDYQDAVRICFEADDPTTAGLFAKYLAEEEDHVDWLEKQIDLIANLGLPLYLQKKVG